MSSTSRKQPLEIEIAKGPPEAMTPSPNNPRRSGLPILTLVVVVSAILLLTTFPRSDSKRVIVDGEFGIRPAELNLRLASTPTTPQLGFGLFDGEPEAWRSAARAKLAELLGMSMQTYAAGPVRELRHKSAQSVTVRVLVMDLSAELSLPAYLLEPPSKCPARGLVMALHGHGAVEPMVGFSDDYHHQFAMWLARNGYFVLCPELRGFGSLRDMTRDDPERGLRYWVGEYGHFTLVMDAFQRGETLIGQTVGDLLRWEDWLASERGFEQLDAVGISYGGDLALCYAALSERVARTFVSGTLGSFDPIFASGGNAPAHCIPGVLGWLERSDIAGLSAPRPLAIHYGANDRPGGNAPGSYNASVEPAFEALQSIYAGFDAPQAAELLLSPERGHEMDVALLLGWLEKDGSGERPASDSAEQDEQGDLQQTDQ